MRAKVSEWTFILAFACLTFGLLYSRFMISLGMLIFLVSAILNNSPGTSIRDFLKNRYYLCVTVIFFLFALSGLWSENTEYFLNRMRIKLPFLFLPYAFFASPRLGIEKMKGLMLFFIGLISLSVFWSVILFLFDWQHYVEIYGKGQILPTPIHHIRYSILVSFAILFSIFLIIKKTVHLIRYERTILLGIAIFLTAYLHVLAVRSGLLSFYIMAGVICIYFAIKVKNRKWSLAMFAGLSAIAIFSVLFIPTVKNKIGYMKYSLELFSKNENIRHLSDSRRLGSIYAGIQLTKEHPLLGVGIGDIMDETNNYLEKNYPDLTELELLPHNQYILGSASLGLPLSIIFFLCTLMPIFYFQGHKDLLLPASNFMFYGSFMVEHTIESQIGVAVYIFILLFCMKFVECSKAQYG